MSLRSAADQTQTARPRAVRAFEVCRRAGDTQLYLSLGCTGTFEPSASTCAWPDVSDAWPSPRLWRCLRRNRTHYYNYNSITTKPTSRAVPTGDIQLYNDRHRRTSPRAAGTASHSLHPGPVSRVTQCSQICSLSRVAISRGPRHSSHGRTCMSSLVTGVRTLSTPVCTSGRPMLLPHTKLPSDSPLYTRRGTACSGAQPLSAPRRSTVRHRRAVVQNSVTARPGAQHSTDAMRCITDHARSNCRTQPQSVFVNARRA